MNTQVSGISIVETPADLPSLLNGRQAVLALGVFDGVHLGHQAIFQVLRQRSALRQAVPCALFFEPNPRVVLQPDKAEERLCSQEENLRRLAAEGVAIAVRLPFTPELAALTPSEFYRSYLQPAAASVCGYVVGENWRFGAGNSGDGQALACLAEKDGARVDVVPSFMLDGAPVSSTRLRKALREGNMALYRRLAGRWYDISGMITHGQGKGHEALSCPTANIPTEGRVLPPFGVYAARGRLADGTLHDGIAYIGDAPTLRGHDVIVELHLFDFNGNLYGQEVSAEFIQFLRPSQMFENASALQAQIGKDIMLAKDILKKETST